jgi:hypothetical protein
MNDDTAHDALDEAALHDSALDADEAALEDQGDWSADAGDDLMAQSADEFSGDEAFSEDEAAFDSGDSADLGEDGAEDLWSAFESEIADGLDAADTDEFLTRVLGALSRAARVARARAPAVAARTQQIAGRAQRLSQGASRVAAAGAQIAGTLGSPTWQRRLQTIARTAGAAGRASGGIAGILGQLLGNNADEADAFEALAEAYQDGIDEALPPAVAMAARAAARGLGFPSVARMSIAARRALVRGVATAARELLRTRSRRAIRTLPALARSTARVAARNAPSPQQAAQTVRQQLPRVAQRVARQPGAMQQAARAANPLTRPTGIGRGRPQRRITGRRTFHIPGPATLTITPR